MKINPYQPTTEISEPSAVDRPITSALAWGIWDVYWRTVLVVSLSGVGFGGVMGCILLLWSPGLGGAGAPNFEVIIFIPIAGAVGGILASVSAAPTVGLLALACRFFMPKRVWTRTRICRFASLGGFLSGFLSIALPAVFDLDALGFSLVPGGFGGVFSLLAMLFLTRHLSSISSSSTPLSIPVDAI